MCGVCVIFVCGVCVIFVCGVCVGARVPLRVCERDRRRDVLMLTESEWWPFSVVAKARFPSEDVLNIYTLLLLLNKIIIRAWSRELKQLVARKAGHLHNFERLCVCKKNGSPHIEITSVGP